jgi:hypothetical protein
MWERVPVVPVWRTWKGICEGHPPPIAKSPFRGPASHRRTCWRGRGPVLRFRWFKSGQRRFRNSGRVGLFPHGPKDLGFHCTYFGAENPSKKTLSSPQNLENKGLEFFLPARSMVLKVVTGKILKTLELSRLLRCSLFLEHQQCRPSRLLRCAAYVRLSKNADYLVDNPWSIMLSQLK